MAGPLYRSDVEVDLVCVQGMSAQVVETGPLDSICGGKGRDFGGYCRKIIFAVLGELQGGTYIPCGLPLCNSSKVNLTKLHGLFQGCSRVSPTEI